MTIASAVLAAVSVHKHQKNLSYINLQSGHHLRWKHSGGFLGLYFLWQTLVYNIGKRQQCWKYLGKGQKRCRTIAAMKTLWRRTSCRSAFTRSSHHKRPHWHCIAAEKNKIPVLSLKHASFRWRYEVEQAKFAHAERPQVCKTSGDAWKRVPSNNGNNQQRNNKAQQRRCAFIQPRAGAAFFRSCQRLVASDGFSPSFRFHFSCILNSFYCFGTTKKINLHFSKECWQAFSIW